MLFWFASLFTILTVLGGLICPYLHQNTYIAGYLINLRPNTSCNTTPTTSADNTLTIIGHLWVNYDRDVPSIPVFGCPWPAISSMWRGWEASCTVLSSSNHKIHIPFTSSGNHWIINHGYITCCFVLYHCLQSQLSWVVSFVHICTRTYVL
jgi:hypothetical protein